MFEKDFRESGPPLFPNWRTDGVALVAILGGLFAFYWAIQWRQFGYSVDGAIYLAGARSLAEGHGYRFGVHAGTPPIGSYPPFQSLYLSLWWRANPAFPGNVPLLNFAMILQALACAGLGYSILRSLRVPVLVSSLLVTCWSTSTYWCQWMFWMFSDFGFMATCLAAALFVMRSEGWPVSGRWAALGGLLATAYLWRTAGAGLIVGMGLVALRHRRTRGWAPVLAFAAPVVIAVFGWNWMRGDAPGYPFFLRHRLASMGGWFEYLRMVAGNLGYVLSGRTFWEATADVVTSVQLRVLPVRAPFAAKAVGLVSGLAFWVVALAATRALLATGHRWRIPMLVVMVVYGLEVLAFPDSAVHFHRYLYPAVPFFVAFGYHGLKEIAGSWVMKHPVIGHLTLAGLIVVILANASFAAFFLPRLEAATRLEELHEVADWVREHSSTNAVVAVSHFLPTQHFYAWSRRPLAVDYFSDEPVSDNPVAHAAQDFVRADYRLTGIPRPAGGRVAEDRWQRELLPVLSSAHGAYRLFAVTPEAEALSRSNILRFRNATLSGGGNTDSAGRPDGRTGHRTVPGE